MMTMQAETRRVVRGQKVAKAKLERAKLFRRDMTPAERLLWARLRRSQLRGLHFRRQQVIDGFIVDFYCTTAGLVVEVDGPVHDTQPEYDAERGAILTAHGIRILRVSNEDVQQRVEAVLVRIAAHAMETTVHS
jgi:very-short-patch-repair endonuclease